MVCKWCKCKEALHLFTFTACFNTCTLCVTPEVGCLMSCEMFRKAVMTHPVGADQIKISEQLTDWGDQTWFLHVVDIICPVWHGNFSVWLLCVDLTGSGAAAASWCGVCRESRSGKGGVPASPSSRLPPEGIDWISHLQWRSVVAPHRDSSSVSSGVLPRSQVQADGRILSADRRNRTRSRGAVGGRSRWAAGGFWANVQESSL